MGHRSAGRQPRYDVARQDAVDRAVRSGQRQQMVRPALEGTIPITCKPKSVPVERTIPMTIPASTAIMLRPRRREETWGADCVFISFSPVLKSATSIDRPV